jgi:hypothetical protein
MVYLGFLIAILLVLSLILNAFEITYALRARKSARDLARQAFWWRDGLFWHWHIELYDPTDPDGIGLEVSGATFTPWGAKFETWRALLEYPPPHPIIERRQA